jgi:hypothetical protein
VKARASKVLREDDAVERLARLVGEDPLCRVTMPNTLGAWRIRRRCL